MFFTHSNAIVFYINKDFIFFLLEYIDGIALKSYIEKKKKNNFRNTYETAFYGAILLCVVHYLHKKKILHRDIKPDNCMIDKNGYLKLIDFGIAKCLKERDFTNTFCGTPHYLAPEVILGKGYAYSSDYWSIGVSMYEIFYGYLPFGMGSKEITDIYGEILNK
jgi:cGMP-dependent protein kinase